MAERIDYRRLSDRLLRGGVSPRRVRRIVRELRDHTLDLKAEAISEGMDEAEAENCANSRLGTEQEVTNQMLASPELRSWAARWPWVIYTLLPPIVMVGLVVTLVLGLILVLPSGESVPDPRDPWFAGAVDTVIATFEYTAAVVLCAVFFWMAVRRRSSSLWLILGVVLVGVLGGSFYINTHWGEYEWRLGVSLFLYPPHPNPLESAIRILANLLLPLAPYLYWMWSQSRHPSRQPE